MDKQCSKCKEVKSIDNFYKHRTNKDGYWGYCKGCHHQYEKEYRLKNPDKQKEYRLKNKDKIKEYKREYFQKNKAEVSIKNRKWAQENKEKVNRASKKRYWKNPDKMRAQGRAWRLKNKDKLKEQRDSRSLEKKEEIKEWHKKYYIKNRFSQMAKMKKYYCENRDEILQKERIINKKRTEELTDTYIKGLLTKDSILSFKDIPQWLVEAKRDEIQLQRIVRSRGRDTWLKQILKIIIKGVNKNG